MTTRKQCLLLTPSLPSSSGSGLQQRAFYLLRDLARDYQVTLLVIGQHLATPSAEIEQLATQIHFLETLPLSAWKRRAALLFPPLLHLFQTWAADWPQVNQNVATPSLNAADCLFVFRMRSHAFLPWILRQMPRPPHIALDIDDIESATLRSIGLRALRRGRLRLALQKLAMSSQYAILERSILRECSEVCYSNPADASFLVKQCNPDHLTLRPNQVSLNSPQTPPAPDRLFTLLFIGTLNYFPNEDAALWIAQKLVPQLRRRLKAPFQILIAGRDAHESLALTLQALPEVHYLGAVDDVDALYRQSHAALAAVRCGGGTKVKILEAAAHGCPVVTTSHSLLGLPLAAGTEILAAASAEEIAICCARLQTDPQFARSMATAAYDRLAACADAAELASTSLPSFRQ